MNNKIVILFIFLISFAACLKEVSPTNDLTAEKVYINESGYKSVLAKVYSSFATTGNQGPSGENTGDIKGIDEGFSDFLRLFWKAQELSTDEAVISWGDAGIQDFHQMNWSSSNPFLTGLYYRILYQITLCNEFIRQSSPANLTKRGISSTDANTIAIYAAEARFLRAFQYWVAMDLFGNVPFATENDVLGSFTPTQKSRADLFTYIESELKAIDPLLVDAKKNEYGRADKAAAWALLARLYLNAEVYTGTAKYTEAITYAKKVIEAGYSLIPKYKDLMTADNNTNTNEFIFTINYDGLKTQGWGGTTFLVHAAIGGGMSAANFGVDGGWGGTRTTAKLVDLFNVADTNRALFYTNGQNKQISDVTKFTDGYAITKFSNKTKAGGNGSNLSFPDTDFPLFRLAEMYLIYAEAILRGGTGGDVNLAVTYINNLRQRGYGSNAGNKTIADFANPTDALNFILDERARELYWEGFRRTDLIRFNRFTESTYLWPWKGGVANGTGVESFRKLYPIPTADLAANPNLKQNTGY